MHNSVDSFEYSWTQFDFYLPPHRKPVQFVFQHDHIYIILKFVEQRMKNVIIINILFRADIVHLYNKLTIK